MITIEHFIDRLKCDVLFLEDAIENADIYGLSPEHVAFYKRELELEYAQINYIENTPETHDDVKASLEESNNPLGDILYGTDIYAKFIGE